MGCEREREKKCTDKLYSCRGDIRTCRRPAQRKIWKGVIYFNEMGRLVQGLVVFKLAFVPQIGEELTPLNVFQNQIEETLVLGEPDHFNLGKKEIMF